MVARLVSADSDTGKLPDVVMYYLRDELSIVVDVTQFGVIDDGTDQTENFNQVVDYVNALNPGTIDAANVIGVTIQFPTGRFRFANPTKAIGKGGVDIKGSGPNGTTILVSHGGNAFSFGNSITDLIVGGSVSDMKIEYLAKPASTAVVFHIEYASRLTFQNLMLVNIGTLMTLGASAARFASSVELVGLRGFVNNSGRPLVAATHGAGVTFLDCRLFVGGVATPAANRTSSMPTVVGTNVIDLGEGGWDTVHMTGCFFERFYRGLNVVTTNGSVVNNIFVTATYFDYFKAQPVFLSSTFAGGGGIFGINISNSWTASWDDAAITLAGPGAIRGVTLNAVRIPSAGTHGLQINAGAQNVQVLGLDIRGVNRTNQNTMGIAVFGGSNILVEGCFAGEDSSADGFAWQAYNGIYVVAAVDDYTVVNNAMKGTQGGYMFETHTNPSKNRRVHGNRNANYATQGTVTVPASGAALSNTSGSAWDVYVSGGTVSSITKDGAPTGVTAGLLRVGPGESMTITYSAAPTLTRVIAG